MGLTLHYRLTARAGTTARGAKAFVRRLHAIATAQVAAGCVARALPVAAERDELERFAGAWIARPHPEDPEVSGGVGVAPEAGWIFPVDLGADSEPLWLGLCRYPAAVVSAGQLVATDLAGRWRFSGSCKTQYAGLHGWEHFRRCHVAAVDLLGAARALGMRVQIDDEGGYWPGRRAGELRRRLERMNGLVAALAGALKDAGDESNGATVQSPIFGHPEFERIEAEGVARDGAAIAAMVKRLGPLTSE